MAQRIVNDRVSKEVVVLRVDIRKKMLSGVKQSWRLETAEAEKKKKKEKKKESVEERKRNSKKIKDVPAAKKVALDFASKVADIYDKLKETL